MAMGMAMATSTTNPNLDGWSCRCSCSCAAAAVAAAGWVVSICSHFFVGLWFHPSAPKLQATAWHTGWESFAKSSPLSRWALVPSLCTKAPGHGLAHWVGVFRYVRRTPKGAAPTHPHQSPGGAWQPQGLVWAGGWVVRPWGCVAPSGAYVPPTQAAAAVAPAAAVAAAAPADVFLKKIRKSETPSVQKGNKNNLDGHGNGHGHGYKYIHMAMAIHCFEQ